MSRRTRAATMMWLCLILYFTAGLVAGKAITIVSMGYSIPDFPLFFAALGLFGGAWLFNKAMAEYRK